MVFYIMGVDDLRPLDCQIVFGCIPRTVLRLALLKRLEVKDKKSKQKLTEACLKLLALIYFRARKDKNGKDGITEPLSYGYMAHSLGVDKGTIVACLDRLSRFEFIVCENYDDPADLNREKSVVIKLRNYGEMFKNGGPGFIRLPWEWLDALLKFTSPVEVRIFYAFALFSYASDCGDDTPYFEISSQELRNYVCNTVRPWIVEKCLEKYKEIFHFTTVKTRKTTIFRCRLDNSMSYAHLRDQNRLDIISHIKRFSDSVYDVIYNRGHVSFNDPWQSELADLDLPFISGWPSFKRIRERRREELATDVKFSLSVDENKADYWEMFDDTCLREYVDKCEKYGVTVVFKGIIKFLRNGAVYKYFTKHGLSNKPRNEYLSLVTDYIRRQARMKLA